MNWRLKDASWPSVGDCMLKALFSGLGGLIVSCGLLISISPLLSAEPSGRTGLTRAEIQEAIDFGKTGTPRPYLLRHAGSDGNPIVVGLVYTPFVRAALLAHAATRRGEAVTPDDFGPDLVEPTAYIAFRWYCCDYSSPANFDPLGPPDPEVIALSAGSSPIPQKAQGVSPVRVHKGSAFVSQYGGLESYEDIALVAEFPMTMLKAGQAFLIFKRHSKVRLQYRLGVIRASDSARWR